MEIKWNPFPENTPEKGKMYLVTVEWAGKNEVETAEYTQGFESKWATFLEGEVIAWAELPEPYEKPVRLKAYPIETVPQYAGVLFLTKSGNYKFSCYISGQTHPKCEGWTHWAHIPEFEFVEDEE